MQIKPVVVVVSQPLAMKDIIKLRPSRYHGICQDANSSQLLPHNMHLYIHIFQQFGLLGYINITYSQFVCRECTLGLGSGFRSQSQNRIFATEKVNERNFPAHRLSLWDRYGECPEISWRKRVIENQGQRLGLGVAEVGVRVLAKETLHKNNYLSIFPIHQPAQQAFPQEELFRILTARKFK